MFSLQMILIAFSIVLASYIQSSVATSWGREFVFALGENTKYRYPPPSMELIICGGEEDTSVTVQKPLSSTPSVIRVSSSNQEVAVSNVTG